MTEEFTPPWKTGKTHPLDNEEARARAWERMGNAAIGASRSRVARITADTDHNDPLDAVHAAIAQIMGSNSRVLLAKISAEEEPPKDFCAGAIIQIISRTAMQKRVSSAIPAEMPSPIEVFEEGPEALNKMAGVNPRVIQKSVRRSPKLFKEDLQFLINNSLDEEIPAERLTRVAMMRSRWVNFTPRQRDGIEKILREGKFSGGNSKNCWDLLLQDWVSAGEDSPFIQSRRTIRRAGD